MIVKKLKKKKVAGLDLLSSTVVTSIKEPFVYNEDVLYPELNDPRINEMNYRSIYDAILDIKQVVPFGYPSEQFLRGLKQDIHNKIEEVKHKKKSSRSGNNADDDEDTNAAIPDSGLIDNENGAFLEFPVNVWGLQGV